MLVYIEANEETLQDVLCGRFLLCLKLKLSLKSIRDKNWNQI